MVGGEQVVSRWDEVGWGCRWWWVVDGGPCRWVVILDVLHAQADLQILVALLAEANHFHPHLVPCSKGRAGVMRWWDGMVVDLVRVGRATTMGNRALQPTKRHNIGRIFDPLPLDQL